MISQYNITDYKMALTATNIRLPREMLQALKIKAAKENTTLSSLMRLAAAQILGWNDKDKVRNPKKDPFLKALGLTESGIHDGSIHHDRDIYLKKH